MTLYMEFDEPLSCAAVLCTRWRQGVQLGANVIDTGKK